MNGKRLLLRLLIIVAFVHVSLFNRPVWRSRLNCWKLQLTIWRLQLDLVSLKLRQIFFGLS